MSKRGNLLEWNANMDLDNGSFHDRLMAAKNHLKLIDQRTPFLEQKIDSTRIALLEENQLNLCKILGLLIEAKEKGL